MSAFKNDDFRPPIGEPATNTTGGKAQAEAAGKQNDDYVQPRIIREHRRTGEVDFTPEELDGDVYFEPPIVRAENLKNDDQLVALFGFEQKCPILFSDLIQALKSID